MIIQLEADIKEDLAILRFKLDALLRVLNNIAYFTDTPAQ